MSNIISARYANGQTLNLKPCYQCDTNIYIRVEGLERTPGLTYTLDACNEGDGIVRSYAETEPFLYKLDDDLFESGRELELYLYVEGDGWGRTLAIWKLLVKDRPRRTDL